VSRRRSTPLAWNKCATITTLENEEMELKSGEKEGMVVRMERRKREGVGKKLVQWVMKGIQISKTWQNRFEKLHSSRNVKSPLCRSIHTCALESRLDVLRTPRT
jgi:hypothetical protein